MLLTHSKDTKEREKERDGKKGERDRKKKECIINTCVFSQLVKVVMVVNVLSYACFMIYVN